MASRQGKLLICPTPLGNLGDVTERSIEALKQCDVVCCEDTRVTGRLLSALGIEKRLERLDEATISHIAQRIVERVLDGEIITYCSDAGMPGVSDPGQRLIDCAYNNGAKVEVLPGPTAVATAYVASGFSAQSFYFGSFFPRKDKERKEILESLKTLPAVLVFYESPKRVASSLQVIAKVMPLRRVAVCRELTKLHEEVFRAISSEVAAEFNRRQQEQSIKGEIVVVIDAPTHEEQSFVENEIKSNAQDYLAQLKAEGTLTNKELVKTLQKEFGISRNEAYEMVHRS